MASIPSSDHGPTPLRCLVTGGAGFIGSHLVDALVAEGHDVVVLDDLSSGSRSNLRSSIDRIRFIEGSILDSEMLAEATRGSACVFHLAAIVSVPLSVEDPLRVHQVNALGTLNVLRCASETGAQVVVTSSAAVYGEPVELPLSERTPAIPLSPYGVQKLTGELYARSFGHTHHLRSTCLRYFNVFGPRQDPASPYSGVITTFIRRALNDETLTIFGDGSQTRDFVYVSDVVQANLAAMRSDVADGRALNVGTGVRTELNDLAQSIIRLAGSGSQIAHAPPRIGDIVHSVSDPTAAMRHLGFSAKTSLASGLGQTIEFFRSPG